MNEWESNPCPEPVDGKPNGQKCKYKVLIIFKVKAQKFICQTFFYYIKIVRHTNQSYHILFQHTGDEGLVTTGTHTTPIHEYIDDLTFTFEVSQSTSEDVKCVVKVLHLCNKANSTISCKIVEFKSQYFENWSHLILITG